MNPFFQPYGTPHDTFPFDKIDVAAIEEAIREGIRCEDAEIARIADCSDAPTFENTILAMECSGSLLDRATTVMYNLSSANTSDALDDLCTRIAPVLSEHSSGIMLNEKLFRRVKQVHDAAGLQLSAEERMLLRRTYEAFERSGATLDAEGKRRFAELQKELSVATVAFAQNHLKASNAFTMHLTAEDEVSGLPETALAQARMAARDRNLDGWLITLKAPSYVPFMTYADRRDLRERLYMAYFTQCTHSDAQCNFGNVARIVNLRRELAQLLGYPTYADYALKRRMAETPEAVNHLLDDLIGSYLPRAVAEVKEVEAMAREMLREAGGKDADTFVLQPWDFAYYSHKLRVRRYDIDAEMLRPYFELSRVKDGVFGLATRLYGITFRRNARIPVYHPDVEAYDVCDADGSFLAVLYCDFHPRESKQSGAWMTNYREQWCDAGGDHRPHVSVVMNFTQPTDDTPALLTLGEVETFLHEFGHALHGMFARTRFKSLSGTNVLWDFVELPSQIMENFSVEREFLSTFACHYKTGEPLPDDLIDRIRASRTFQAAYQCMRQVSFGLLDMAYYSQAEPFTADVREFENRATERVGLLPRPAETCMSVQFGHIMNGGYSAGYYSYKWAEVLDADAFSLFREQGVFSTETARSFRENILSRGGTEPPMQLYVRFRGREPRIDALLERDGIASAAPAVANS